MREDIKGVEYFMKHLPEVIEHVKGINEEAVKNGRNKMTMRQYLNNNGFSITGRTNCYIVKRGITDVRGKQVGEKEKVRHCGNEWWIAKIPMYEYTSYIKALDIDDPDLKMTDLPVVTCHADAKCDRIENFKEITHTYCFIR